MQTDCFMDIRFGNVFLHPWIVLIIKKKVLRTLKWSGKPSNFKSHVDIDFKFQTSTCFDTNLGTITLEKQQIW